MPQKVCAQREGAINISEAKFKGSPHKPWAILLP